MILLGLRKGDFDKAFQSPLTRLMGTISSHESCLFFEYEQSIQLKTVCHPHPVFLLHFYGGYQEIG